MKTHKDLVSGSFLLLLGLFLSIRSTDLRIWSKTGPGPGFFPLTVGLIICLLSVILILQGILRHVRSKRGQDKTKRAAAVEPEHERPALLKVCSYIVLMVVYGLLMNSVGFLIITFLYLFIVLKYTENQGWRRTLLIGSIATVVSYLVFEYYLGVPLPLGFMKNLLY
jgi:putative tricarboxylic transport membrane protein